MTACSSDPQKGALDREAVIGPWGDPLGEPLTAVELDDLGLVPLEWAGYSANASPGIWYDLGAPEWEDPSSIESQQPLADLDPTNAATSPEGDWAGTFVYVDYVAARHYMVLATPDEIDFAVSVIDNPDAQTQEAGAALPELYVSTAGDNASDQSPGIVVKPEVSRGWSTGVDDRVKVTNTGVFPFRTVGTQAPNQACTGTLVGQKWVLTAAHCLTAQGQGNYQRYYWQPGWEWANARNGNIQPYADEPIKGVFIPIQWTQAGQQLYWYRAYDYSLIALQDAPDPMPGQPPAGWMLKYVSTDAELYGRLSLQNVGYPNCDEQTGVPPEGPPVGCQAWTQWRDPNRCVINDFDQNIVSEPAQGQMVATLARASCDMNGGHSGGPIYDIYEPGVGRVFGVAVQRLCDYSQCATHAYGQQPNLFRRLTDPMLSQLNFWAGFVIP